MSKSFIISFGAGAVFGFGCACLIFQTSCSAVEKNRPVVPICSRWNRGDRPHHANEVDARSHKGLLQNDSRPNWTTSGNSSDVKTKAIRILCWIMTSPSNHDKKAIHVLNTWGKRCDKLLFMSSKADDTLGAIALSNVEEGRDWLWAKTKEAFKYVWTHYKDEADRFMKADDDTFVIVENLRSMLSEFDTNSPVYFACRFKPYVKQGYMSGGAGYVLSKEALRRFVEQALPDEQKCKQSHDGPEDIIIGQCLEAVGVKPADSRDNLGRYRFLPFSPELHMMPGPVDESFWYWQRTYYPQSLGMDCCSETAISFHYISPKEMYLLEYLIYHFRVQLN